MTYEEPAPGDVEGLAPVEPYRRPQKAQGSHRRQRVVTRHACVLARLDRAVARLDEPDRLGKPGHAGRHRERDRPQSRRQAKGGITPTPHIARSAAGAVVPGTPARSSGIEEGVTSATMTAFSVFARAISAHSPASMACPAAYA